MSEGTASAVSSDELRAMLLEVCARVVDSQSMLCQADRDIGDGDHGLGMARGFGAAAERLRTAQLDSVDDVLDAVSDALLRKMGGASGVVFGLLFRPERETDDASVQLGVERLARHFAAAQAEIARRGGAQVGDKTMLDALAPAVGALQESDAQGLTVAHALACAAAAAHEGAAATRLLVARRGKAMTLGERARGFPDPGALSTALIFQAMADWSFAHEMGHLPATSVAGPSKEREQ